MTLAFGIGVIGGPPGSVLRLPRQAGAMPVLAVSLAACVALWIADAVPGVFAATGAPQVVVVPLVAAIAAALFALSRHPAAKG